MKRSKHILALFLLVSSLWGAQWDDPTLPQADPDKHVYQLDWGWFPPGHMWMGGKWSAKRIPTADDMKERIEYERLVWEQKEQQKQIKRANNLMLCGLLVAIACIVVHGCSSLPMLKRIAEYGIVGGVVGVVGGIGYKWLIKNEVALGWAFGIAVVCALAYWILSHDKVRDWSISHIFTGKKG